MKRDIRNIESDPAHYHKSKRSDDAGALQGSRADGHEKCETHQNKNGSQGIEIVAEENGCGIQNSNEHCDNDLRLSINCRSCTDTHITPQFYAEVITSCANDGK